MKLKLLICSLLLSTFAFAEEAEKPEPSEPPFEVGAMPMESGYTIKREGAPDLNFRIVESNMRLYWIDEEGLIMEPEVTTATIRFEQNTLRETRFLHQLNRLPDDAGLGSPYLLRLPHLYIMTLVIEDPKTGEIESHRFRYTPDMDEVKAPSATTPSS